MDVAVSDPILNDVRLIKYIWHEKGASSTPPKTWYSAVIGEVQFQRGQELARKHGRLIPRNF